MDIYDLSGKTALVTGGSRGIGFALSRGLARAGATVIIANRNEEQGEDAAKRLRGEGLAVSFKAVDIGSLSSIEALFVHVEREFGGLDILLNNAAVIIRKPALEFSEADWDATIDINLKGTFFCSQKACEIMKKKGKGKIINVSSVLSQMCQHGRAVYSVTKAGIAHMTKALAMEWSRFGINVNCFGPGMTFTELNEQHFKDNPDDLAHILSGIPLARGGVPDDYVGVAVFLASSASDYVAGQTLLVDGGMVIP